MKLNEVVAPDYEADFAQWLECQLNALEQRQFEKLDVENLIDEIGGILRSEKREIRSRLKIITLHLLKCQFQPGLKGRSWVSTLHTQRTELADLLRDSPSLRPHLKTFAEEGYPHARYKATLQTGLPDTVFPATLPYTLEQLLDTDYVP